jgi:hypothetical protein
MKKLITIAICFAVLIACQREELLNSKDPKTQTLLKNNNDPYTMNGVLAISSSEKMRNAVLELTELKH